MPRGGQAWFSVVVVVLTANFSSNVSAQAAEEVAFFEKSIRLVLVQHCYKCHSAEAASKGKLKAGLLDTRQGMLTGGESGPS